MKILKSILAFMWCMYLIFSLLTPVHIIQQASISSCFALVLCFVSYPIGRNKGTGSIYYNMLNWLCIIGAIVTCGYIAIKYEVFLRGGLIATPTDIFLGTILLILILDSTRRIMGPIIPILVIICIFYTYFGNYLPGKLAHAGFSHTRLIEYLYIGTRGFWGTITGIISMIIPIFIIFGAMLLITGGGQTLNDLASQVAGKFHGGAAKASLVASALFGSISGSSVSNVATTGAFSIPMMKNLGYQKEMAGAVEASASTGGQILPPVMGAGAFVMAEILGIPYTKVCLAATIPALLYFGGVLIGIHFESRRVGLGKLPPDMIPSLKTMTLSRLVRLLLPIIILIYLLVRAYTPGYAALWALIASISLTILSPPFDFWSFKKRISTITQGFINGGQNLLGVFCLILTVQVMVSIIGLTGVGVKLSAMVISLGGKSLIGALVICGMAALVMGMGMPTTAAYVLGATILGGALTEMGLPPLSAHMFIFYYAIISVITPPVCAAVYVAAGMAEASWWKTAIVAIKLAAPAYFIPFAFVANQELLGVDTSFMSTAVTLSFTIIGTFSLAAASIGYFIKNTSILERFIFFIASILLIIYPSIIANYIGTGLFAIALVSQKYINGRIRTPFLTGVSH